MRTRHIYSHELFSSNIPVLLNNVCALLEAHKNALLDGHDYDFKDAVMRMWSRARPKAY